jgi:hypothetical protein
VDFTKLSLNFFKFYGEEFNFKENVVCPFLGWCIYCNKQNMTLKLIFFKLGMPLERKVFDLTEIDNFPIKR